jgi:CheY-like chemotaxis protein
MEEAGATPPETIPLILVADDDPLIRKILNQRLRSAGYWVLTAENGQECVERYRAPWGSLWLCWITRCR